MKNRLFGHTGGLKADHLRRLNNLYRRKTSSSFLVTPELARELCLLSREIRRQIGLLVDRKGTVSHVIVGTDAGIVIPDTGDYRTAAGRLRGLKCIHTHLNAEALTADDITDLSLLRLDIMAVVADNGGPDENPRYRVHGAHLLPGNGTGGGAAPTCKQLAPLGPGELDIGCEGLITALENELARAGVLRDAARKADRAILVSVTGAARSAAVDSLTELAALAASADITVVDTVLQHRKKTDPRFLIGRGKLGELAVLALQTGASLLVFDQELNPSQIRSITDQVDLKVIDRTQLILDIFARRAQSMEGKLQVEHAQLKYLLPRLATKNTAMSRLTGGIGGRGPGETKLEINRRRVRERLTQLELRLEAIKKQRRQQKSRRDKLALPVISLIGYTNAGKSTLLNTLTQSRVAAADRLFMTLDPSSRRMRFPREMEVVITDTVGFIRDLPKELMVAFRATLEELERADLFVHVVDAANPMAADQISAVERIVAELSLSHTPVVYALNKMDRAPAEQLAGLINLCGGIPVSANNGATLAPLIDELVARVEKIVNHRRMLYENYINPEG
ncbi:MAG: GTPase HflX [Thermodesulfobacteriota bacterium]